MLFLLLGFWQLDRSEQRQAILEGYQHSLRAQAVRLDEARKDYAELRYQSVWLRGEYQPQKQFLLDNQMRNGIAGVQVLTPFKTELGHWVLVDRGWVALDARRQLTASVGLIASKPLTINAYIYVPFAKAFSLGGMDDGQWDWPKTVQFLDFAQMAERLEVPLLPLVLRLRPDQAQAYQADWPLVSMSPERNFAYAVQWFALATAVMVVFLILTFRTAKDSHECS